MNHDIRHQIWQRNNPGKAARQIRDPRKWDGKLIPACYAPLPGGAVHECDCCGRFFVNPDDACHNLYPQTDAEWDAVAAGVGAWWDVAYGFCDRCYDGVYSAWIAALEPDDAAIGLDDTAPLTLEPDAPNAPEIEVNDLVRTHDMEYWTWRNACIDDRLDWQYDGIALHRHAAEGTVTAISGIWVQIEYVSDSTAKLRRKWFHRDMVGLLVKAAALENEAAAAR